MQEGTSALSLTAVAPPRVLPPPRAARAVTRPLRAPGIPMPETRAVPGAPAKRGNPARSRTRAIERPHMKLDFRTVARFGIAVTILMFIVYGNMQLSQLQRENQKMKVELTLLQRQENQLRGQFENTVQLSEVERYAVSELGMVKPDASQILYIDLGGEDHAEVIEQKSFWQSIQDMLSSAMVTKSERGDISQP